MKKKIIIAVAVIVILAAGGTFYLNHKVSSAVKDGKIIKGVSCEGISINFRFIANMIKRSLKRM